jgi:hypothetical protein
MANPNPNPATRFKPGQAANPGGKTSEQRRLEVENAERAMRIRDRLLRSVEAKLAESDMDASVEFVEAAMLKLLKDSEDRGLGAPVQSVDMKMSLGTALDELPDE